MFDAIFLHFTLRSRCFCDNEKFSNSQIKWTQTNTLVFLKELAVRVQTESFNGCPETCRLPPVLTPLAIHPSIHPSVFSNPTLIPNQGHRGRWSLSQDSRQGRQSIATHTFHTHTHGLESPINTNSTNKRTKNYFII